MWAGLPASSFDDGGQCPPYILTYETMGKEIKPCKTSQATLTLPGSKSYTHRALMAAALAAGESVLSNALAAEDTELTARALAQLGAGIDWQGTTIRVMGRGGRWLPAPLPIYLGNSGTSMRFLTALAALGEGEYLLTGSERLCQRPLGELLAALGQIGVRAASEKGDGCPPVRVVGGLTGGRANFPGPSAASTCRPCCSSGPWRPKGLEIEITGSLVSRPYVDLTLEVLGEFGVTYYREGYRFFQLPGGQCYLPQTYEIEADASSASYFWAAAALTGGRVTITNLGLESSQGDAAFPEVLGRMGCAIESTPAGLTVTGGPLSGRGSGHGRHAGPGAHPGGAGGVCPRRHGHHRGGPPAPQGIGPPGRGGRGIGAKWVSRPGRPPTAWSFGAGRPRGRSSTPITTTASP